jgi:UDP-N-acetylmuramate dehydrogenase
MNPVVSHEEFERLQARNDAAVPHYPAPDGVKLAAAWLVEQAGFNRGFPHSDAPARLSTKHALAVTNRGTATAADVAWLAATVREGVRAAFGVNLMPEPVLVGVTI